MKALQIGRFKLWFNSGGHCCGIHIFRIPIIGWGGRKRTIEPIFGMTIGGFHNYWIWRFTLTIFQKKTELAKPMII